MTYIEFFDKDLIENICTSLTNPPERVILVGSDMKLLQKHAERYTDILLQRGAEVEFVCKSVNKNKMQDVVAALSSIVETYDDCVFDLTGGEDIFLVCTGIVFERYKEKNIQMHRFNIRNNTIQDCDFDGKTILETELPQLTVEENIRIYGGDVVYDDIKPDTTPSWDFEGDFADDIDLMWDICKTYVRLWNKQIGVFMMAEQFRGSESNPLTVTAPVPYLKENLERINAGYVFDYGIINALYRAGLIEAHDDGYEFTITYKNEQVKKCLTKAGRVLELKIFVAAIRACEKNGSYVYNDVMNGVYIDWDGDIHTEQESHDTANEIDVMMMHGMVPVFVSCKNGRVGMDELYKLNTVATRFGGKYAKRVLIATALDRNENADDFRERAKEMRIRIVEKIQDMDETDLQKEIRTFWKS